MENYIFNKSPLVETKFAKLPLGSVKPEGWLYNQLRAQADGLTGYLDEIWESVGENSGWLGGTGENWERGPYYCDGLIPLAYLLEDNHLIKKSKKWIEWTLNSQDEDGFFGPKQNHDWWPRMVMLKVLTQYYEAEGDARVIKFMQKYFKYQYEHIDKEPLKIWGVARGAENLLSIFWLYNRTGDEFLLDLSDKIFSQTTDWTSVFEEMPYKDSMKKYLDFDHFLKYAWDGILNPTEITKEEADSLFKTYHQSHVVNVAMGIKEPGVYYQRSHDPRQKEAVKNGIEQLREYHGVVSGMFTGDEHLSGNNPSQGTELCSVVEYMFSMENLMQIFGDAQFGDILEKVAYNALPATIKPDFWGHQYDQQANQVECSKAKRNWYNNGDDSNTFGLEPNFGCCTANMHQGWPKFVQNMWMATDDNGLAATAYGPCSVSAKAGNGVNIKINEETNYPFDSRIQIRVKCDEPVKFPLKLRMPGWAEKSAVYVNDEKYEVTDKGTFYTILREWHDEDVVKLDLPMYIKISRWFNNSAGVERGPLVYSLRIGERWVKAGGIYPYADWEVYPETPWNYGLVIDEAKIESSFKVVQNRMTVQPFNYDNPPIEIIAEGKRIPNWKMEDNSAGTLPQSPVKSDEITEGIVLIPYGCAKLRISEFPVMDTDI